jgi:hypothetical protein
MLNSFRIRQDSIHLREDTILIMKRTEGESIGIFHCRHCAIEFDDEIQLSSHLRLHFFI